MIAEISQADWETKVAFSKLKETKASWRHKFNKTEASCKLAEKLQLQKQTNMQLKLQQDVTLNMLQEVDWSSETYDVRVFSFGSGTIPGKAFTESGEYVEQKKQS